LDLRKYGNAFEFLSEQTVEGGESDIVILCESHEVWEFYVELKNAAVVHQGRLTTKGKEAVSQVAGYHNVRDKRLTLRGIGGKNSSSDQSLTIHREGELQVFEVDAQTPLTLLS
jgi:hypothetical protein